VHFFHICHYLRINFFRLTVMNLLPQIHLSACMKHIPNIVTLMNLFLGSIAVVLAIKGQPQVAAIMIGICAVLDIADGTLARLLSGRSELGVQLDSLADLISFGLGPSAIMYHYLSIASQDLNQSLLIALLPYSAFIMSVFAGLRLAIFNLDTRQLQSFIGLPTPANAGFFASLPFVLAFASQQGVIYNAVLYFTGSIPAMLIGLVIFSGLMVSPLPMFSLKIKNLSWKQNKVRYIFLALVAGTLAIAGLQAIALITLLYLVISLIQFLLQLKNQPSH